MILSDASPETIDKATTTTDQVKSIPLATMNSDNDNDNDTGNGSFLEAVISSDLALKIIQYLNVVDSGRLACVSRRYYYLVHQYRRLRGPEIATTSLGLESVLVSKRNHKRLTASMVKDCKQKIQAKPNLVLHFCLDDIAEGLAKNISFGNETVGLGAITYNAIQVYQPAPRRISDSDCASLMAMNFPGAIVLPFSIQGTPGALDLNFLEKRLKYHNKNSDDKFWKALILYATDHSQHEIPTRMQALVPNAVLFGGVCDEGHVSVPKFSKEELSSMSVKHLRYVLKKHAVPKAQAGQRPSIVEKSDLVNHVFDALKNSETCNNNNISYETMGSESFFGVFLGGDVPVRSVVSRGVCSVLNSYGPPRPFSDLVVEESELIQPFGDSGPLVHSIRKVKDKTSGAVYEPTEVVNKYLSSRNYQSQFVGLKRRGCDGFVLSAEFKLEMDTFIVMAVTGVSVESLEGAELDFYNMNGKASMEDMDRTMLKLKEQTEGEEIIGALMYTCSARGPAPGDLIPERMSDATRFANVFQDVPCLGFYANGEFGPVALAANENIFQIGRSMHQAVSSKVKLDIFFFPFQKHKIIVKCNLDQFDSFDHGKHGSNHLFFFVMLDSSLDLGDIRSLRFLRYLLYL